MQGPTRKQVIWLGLALAACGSKSDDGGGGETDTGGSTTVPATCEGYGSDDDIGPAVTMSLVHEGSTPVYFSPVGCGGNFPISIKAEGGEPFGYQLGECFPVVCESFFDLDDCSVGCNDCEGPPLGRIDPGADRATAWSGVVLTPLEMTAACAPGAQCQTGCLREDQAEAGTYELEVTVFRTCTGNCDCDGDPVNGVCQIWQYDAELSDPSTYSVTFEYPAQTQVDLVIDP